MTSMRLCCLLDHNIEPHPPVDHPRDLCRHHNYRCPLHLIQGTTWDLFVQIDVTMIIHKHSVHSKISIRYPRRNILKSAFKCSNTTSSTPGYHIICHCNLLSVLCCSSRAIELGLPRHTSQRQPKKKKTSHGPAYPDYCPGTALTADTH